VQDAQRKHPGQEIIADNSRDTRQQGAAADLAALTICTALNEYCKKLRGVVSGYTTATITRVL
jgi:hypothetical protein